MIKIGVLIEEKELSEKEKTIIMTKACLGVDDPKILYTGGGMPHSCIGNDNKRLRMDASFSSNSAAVVITDEYFECAVDIQSGARVGLGRLFELFGSHSVADDENSESEIKSDIGLSLLISSEDGIRVVSDKDFKLSYISPSLAARDSLLKWTVLESGIKCNGTKGIKTKTLLIKYKKNRYGVTITVSD